MRISFLGGAGTVTGSKYLLSHEHTRILVDCGLFQGYKQLRLRNREPFPLAPKRLDAVVLTHAHLDHCGYLPVLARDGFRGPVYVTEATCELAEIILRDSARLQEEEAKYANRKGYSKHHPAEPLYTEADAERALRLLKPYPLHRFHEIVSGVQVCLRPAGHILGAATVEVRIAGSSLVFSGDLGRPNDPLMVAPEPIEEADYLLVESTYGNRLHPQDDTENVLAEVINRTALRHGITVVPSFAVGRAQQLMYHLHRLKQQGRIPDLPVYLNSPMATDVTALYQRFASEHRLSHAQCQEVCRVARFVRTVDESKRLEQQRSPAVIIAGSGMATGGRVLHHLKALAPDPRNTILLSGFQAGGTRGAQIAEGAESVRIHGEDVPIRAEVVALESLSAHADANEVLAWLRNFRRPPKQCFVVHGEPAAADALRWRIGHELGWSVCVPEHRQRVQLDEVAECP
ncbi:MAG: MBL fold metallo-hydrolase [Pseudomonadaceae bacterium]|nr:MBL fold metallo-hydrolase [Pseudomonadaceae bacterium]